MSQGIGRVGWWGYGWTWQTSLKASMLIWSPRKKEIDEAIGIHLPLQHIDSFSIPLSMLTLLLRRSNKHCCVHNFKATFL